MHFLVPPATAGEQVSQAASNTGLTASTHAQMAAFVPVQIPISTTESGRKLTLNRVNTMPANATDRSNVDLDVALTNEGNETFALSTGE